MSLEPNPIQLSRVDAAMPMGCALHPEVSLVDLTRLLHCLVFAIADCIGLHCSCICARNLDRVEPLIRKPRSAMIMRKVHFLVNSAF